MLLCGALNLIITLLFTVSVQCKVLRVVDGQSTELNTLVISDHQQLHYPQHHILPANYSGPEHLTPLQGSCYHFTNDRYNYRLCLFSDLVQQDLSTELLQQHYSLPVTIGVYNGWDITDEEFSTLVYDEGDTCNNNGTTVHRQAKVEVQCGSPFLSWVKEDRPCQYTAQLLLPGACGAAARAVYPRLPPVQRHAWDSLWGRRQRGLLTEAGYQAGLRVLYKTAGLLPVRRSLRQEHRGGDSCEERVKTLEARVARLQMELQALKDS